METTPSPSQPTPSKKRHLDRPATRGLAALVIAAALVMFLMGGCTTNVYAPDHVKDPVTIYLVDYGKHAGIILPTTQGALVEWGWGDWTYFALEQKQWYNAVKAMLYSSASALSKRPLDDPHDVSKLTQTTSALTLTPILVERSKADALEAQLEQRFNKNISTEVTSSWDPNVKYVRESEHYWLLHNSNQAVGTWLGDSGCDVHGWSVVCDFVVHQSADTPQPTVPSTRPTATLSISAN